MGGRGISHEMCEQAAGRRGAALQPEATPHPLALFAALLPWHPHERHRHLTPFFISTAARPTSPATVMTTCPIASQMCVFPVSRYHKKTTATFTSAPDQLSKSPAKRKISSPQATDDSPMCLPHILVLLQSAHRQRTKQLLRNCRQAIARQCMINARKCSTHEDSSPMKFRCCSRKRRGRK